MLTLLPIITDDICSLHEARTAAMRAYSAAAKACRDAAAADAPIKDQIALDFVEREALTASCDADRAYDAALSATQVAA